MRGRDYLSVTLDDPKLSGSNLRNPDRGRRRGRPLPHLVPHEPGLNTNEGPADGGTLLSWQDDGFTNAIVGEQTYRCSR
jgi:hypothetical protein